MRIFELGDWRARLHRRSGVVLMTGSSKATMTALTGQVRAQEGTQSSGLVEWKDRGLEGETALNHVTPQVGRTGQVIRLGD